MEDEQVKEGDTVTITTDRIIAGRSWHGEHGVVYSTFLRNTIPDWVIVRVHGRDIALRPDEIDVAP